MENETVKNANTHSIYGWHEYLVECVSYFSKLVLCTCELCLIVVLMVTHKCGQLFVFSSMILTYDQMIEYMYFWFVYQ